MVIDNSYDWPTVNYSYQYSVTANTRSINIALKEVLSEQCEYCAIWRIAVKICSFLECLKSNTATRGVTLGYWGSLRGHWGTGVQRGSRGAGGSAGPFYRFVSPSGRLKFGFYNP